jgi:hypothetical protein
MSKPEKKRGRKPDALKMTPEQGLAALDRMLGKKPEGEQPPPADAPKVRSKRPAKRPS